MFRLSTRGTAVAVTVIVLVATAGCGADRSGGPRGSSTEVVMAAARRTRNASSARVAVAAPGAQVTGVIDFVGDCSTLKVTGPSGIPMPGSAAVLPGRLPRDDPKGVLDLLSAVKKINVYGGAEVRGASTIRYELTLSLKDLRRKNPAVAVQVDKNLPGLASVFPASIYVDSKGRILRLQFPEQLSSTSTIVSSSGVNVEATTIDFFAFGTAVSCR